MRKIIDRSYAKSHIEEIINAIKRGALFIYPTDTIYGIGCDATNNQAVLKIRSLKNRFTKPFSIIAPGKDWMRAYTKTSKEALEKFPGPYTLIVNWRNENPLAKGINLEDNTIGVRIPNHWFSHFIEKAGVPFVTTSVNISGEKHMESLDGVLPIILDSVDCVVYEGPKNGKPSIKLNYINMSS